MSSSSTQIATILEPCITLKGHAKWITSICYFPDGQRMISGSEDKTTRQWNLKAGKEVEEARDFYERVVYAVAVSRNGRWIVTGGGGWTRAALKARDVGTGAMKIFEGHAGRINCIDISEDNTLMASASFDQTTRIWNLDTGELVAGPFKSSNSVIAIRFSTDAKKLAVKSGLCLEIWDIRSQTLDVTLTGKGDNFTCTPIFWTNNNRNILALFGLPASDPSVYEFDASTLQTVGTRFEEHTKYVSGLALSFDHTLLASAGDHTIKLWAFESRQLLASFDVHSPNILVLSPDSRQLAYTAYTEDNRKIYICDIPPEVFAQTTARLKGPTEDLESLPVIAFSHPSQIPSSTVAKHWFGVRNGFRNLFSSSRTQTVSVEPDDLKAMSQDLSEYIIKDEDYPAARGGFGEIWKCTCHINPSPIKIAVKTLQVYIDDQLGPTKTKKIQRIMREFRICANLNHPNILRIYGYTHGFGPFPAIVSLWAENGNLSLYLEREGAALTLVRRFKLLTDIIAGLRYLHANNIIHGDFNGPNVLIHGDGTACIADFGLSLMYSEFISASQASYTSTLKGNVRWMAPELLVEREDGSQVRPSEQSDMYSFGGVMLQVLTNKVPYYHLTNDGTITLCIAKSQTPSRSRYPELPEQYWPFIEQCWSTNPWGRPSADGADEAIRNEFYSLSR